MAEGITTSTLLSCQCLGGRSGHGDCGLTAYNGSAGSGRCHWPCVLGCFVFVASSLLEKEPAQVVWNMIHPYYKDANVPDRLDTLTEDMINDDKQPPMQKGQGCGSEVFVALGNQAGGEFRWGKRALENCVNID